ncbi:hypothetical protein [Streptomyces sp. JL7001]|uniref:hypothetical protein n=1 Tax=Streptomyces sp. JL7001 TaxID=3445784 RepID=UPI003F7AE181
MGLVCEAIPAFLAWRDVAAATGPPGCRSTGNLHRDDVRHAQPRFQGTNLAADLTLVQRLRDRAAEVGCTSAQSRSPEPAAAATSTTTSPPCPCF